MTGPAPSPAITLEGVVAWADTDASGWIHFTAPQRWAEEAEHRLYRSADVDVDPGRFPRREVRTSYTAPLRAGDRYQVDLHLERLDTTSVTWRWTVTTAGRLCVEGAHTAVHLGEDGRPDDLPAALRDALTGR